MATVKKLIGRLPVYKGDWVAGSYSMLNQVSYLGSTFQSKIDNNTSQPATLVNNVLQVNSNWNVISNGTAAYLADSRLTSVEGKTVQLEQEKVALSVNNLGLYSRINNSGTDILPINTLREVINDLKVIGALPENISIYLKVVNKWNGGESWNNYVGVYYSINGQSSKILADIKSIDGYIDGIYKMDIKDQSVGISEMYIALKWSALQSEFEVQHIYNDNSIVFNNDYITDLLSDSKINIERNTITEGIYIESKSHTDIEVNKVNSKLLQSDDNVYQLPNDLNALTGTYGYKNIGQYTKRLRYSTVFDRITINGISSAAPKAICKVYDVYLNNLGDRECPVGTISESTHTLIAEKEIQLSTSRRNYDIDIPPYVANKGHQIVAYIVCNDTIDMQGNIGKGNSDLTSNVALLNVNENPFASSWGAGSVDADNNGYFNVALTLVKKQIFATLKDIKGNLKIALPSVIYALEGLEMNIWNDTIALSIDRGLASPLNYQVFWYCSKGMITERGYRLTATASDVGEMVDLKCIIVDDNNNILDECVSSIKIIGKASLVTQKRIVYFGDSLGAESAIKLFDNFNNPNVLSGVTPIMIGSRGYTVRYEAVGGYGWADYATKGSNAYRIQVSGVTSLSVGARYTHKNEEYTIREVNITEGVGNCLIERDYGMAGSITGSGILNKVSGAGDDAISFSSATQEANNPLWNNTTNRLDVAAYRSRLGIAEKIDAVSFQFGMNDHQLAADLTTLERYISDLYNAFISDNPNCKVLIGLTTSSGNTKGGIGANYGAAFNVNYLSNVQKIREFYLTLPAKYPNIFIIPVHNNLDRYYGYDLGERAVSSRVNVVEKYHTNYVHPISSGYHQIADAYTSAYVGVLAQ